MFPNKNVRRAAAPMVDPMDDPIAEWTATAARTVSAVVEHAASTAVQAATPAARAVAEMAQPATRQLGGLHRTRTVCDIRPSAEAFEAHAALARRIVENATTAYNAGRSLTAETARHLADILSDRHLADAPAAGVFQRGLSRNPSQLQPQATGLLDAARREGLAPIA